MKLQTKLSRVIDYEVPSYHKSIYTNSYFRITAEGITKVYNTALIFIPVEESNAYFEEISFILDKYEKTSYEEFKINAEETANYFKNII